MLVKPITLLPLLLGGCAAFGGSPAERDQAERLAYTPSGQAVSCVPLSQIRETRVLGSDTIDFLLKGGERLRNTIPNGCPGLGIGDGITYSTSLSQLCNVDVFTVLQRGGGLIRGASCGLGSFQPVSKVAR